jgi:hypothetical protein
MPSVELRFSHGQLRQPGLWGKTCHPSGTVMDYDEEKDVDLTVERSTHTFAFPQLPEETYLILGLKGYFARSQAGREEFTLLGVVGNRFAADLQNSGRCQISPSGARAKIPAPGREGQEQPEMKRGQGRRPVAGE